MDLLRTKSNSTVVQCFCDSCERGCYNLAGLRKAAEDHCPLCALWLACLDTIVHKLINNGYIEKIWIWPSAQITLEWRGQKSLRLAMFHLNGRSKR
jgi:hypothetical protein